jgi:hypothetical protein
MTRNCAMPTVKGATSGTSRCVAFLLIQGIMCPVYVSPAAWTYGSRVQRAIVYDKCVAVADSLEVPKNGETARL